MPDLKRSISMRRLTGLVLLLGGVLTGCFAGQHVDERPLPVDNPNATSLDYLLKADYHEVREAATKVLGERFSLSRPRTGTTAYDTPYWHLDSKYSFYRRKGKRYRSDCSVHVIPFKDYPAYSELSVSCDLYSYSFGFGRGGICNLFSYFWWDWFPEQRLYLAQEVGEDVVHKLGIGKNDIIRLRKVYSYEEEIAIIREHLAKQTGVPIPAGSTSDTTGSIGIPGT